METKDIKDTNVDPVNMSEPVEGGTPQPRNDDGERTAFVSPSDRESENGLDLLAVKNDGTQISNGVMLTLRTGVVHTKNMVFAAGTTGKTSENFLAHNWTKRKMKLLFVLNKYLPTHKKAVRDYKQGLDAPTLWRMEQKGETFLNELTQVVVPLRDLSLALDPVDGGRAEMMEKTMNELKEIARIETTYFFNGVITDGNIILRDTGDLLTVKRTQMALTYKNGKPKTNKDGKQQTFDKVKIIYNNLWLYGYWTRVPANVVDLLDMYGNDTALFLRLFVHFIDVRGTKTSEKHITTEVNKKVAAMKKNNTRGGLWSGFLHNTRNKQVSAVYTQQRVLDILGKRDDGGEWYTTTKKWTDKKTGMEYNYKNFKTTKFRDDLTRAVEGCTNMGLLTVARVFTIPRDEKKAEKVVADLCHVFPGLARNIEKLTPSDGICCCVTFNGKWGDETEPVEAVEVKDGGTPSEHANR